ncbi:MAG TPA: PQQ-binding-like beta-propeller repeat protein, partial [Candidatus Sulfotelmatobacter sp.]|nr:PQQ-binding-like beta-propeller repeat protein [Candidatus Sulfotelmatobacter sp.]
MPTLRPSLRTSAFVALWLLVGLVIGVSVAAAELDSSWPTLRGDLQRSGFYPHFPKGPLKVRWRKELWKELTGPRAEVIVAEGKAFLGTYAGIFHAWELDRGAESWRFQTGGPIGHAAMYAQGAVFVGSMDRRLYALEAASGKLRWSFEAGEGIWVSPVVWRGKVFFGARDGVFYALESATGKLLWQHPTGDRILTSAALSEDGEQVVFASEDMHIYCLGTANGQLLWKSRKLAGLSVRDYAPVIVRGLVLVTTNPVKDFHTVLGENENMLIQRTGFHGTD